MIDRANRAATVPQPCRARNRATVPTVPSVRRTGTVGGTDPGTVHGGVFGVRHGEDPGTVPTPASDIVYTLYGDPQAWVRPRSNGRRHFTPQHVLDEEQRHREAALLCRPDGWPMDAGYVLHIDFFMGTVKSGPRKGLRKRLDTDNAVKLIFDGLIGAAYDDDEQVDDHHVRRRVDALDPRTEIRVVVREAGE